MNRYVILDRINSPADVKNLTPQEADLLAEEIRDFLITNIPVTGGHLASNLGTVELTLALHRVFGFPTDHLIFDVGHQCYTHKLITGRREGFSGLRKRGGISGFTKMSESEYDCFGAGHSSTSVSAAIGFAEAERLKGSDAYTVAVLGDGAFTGGMVHEALNNCRPDLRLIIILNENEMSISKNTGAFADLIAKIRASEGYYNTKRRTVRFVLKIPFVGRKLFRLIRGIKKSVKDRVFGSNYFEDLGLYYLGPVDGNDRVRVERLLREAKAARQSTVVHIKTVKGKGYAPAEENPGKYHSVRPAGQERERNFSLEAGDILTGMAKADSRICAVTAAMAAGTGLEGFRGAIPERFFDVGIAEEHALTFSAGLAADGMRPFFAVYSSFLQRGYDNLIHDIALQKLPVTVLVDRAGLSFGDGPTHHGIFDVPFLLGIPQFRIFTPSCFDSLKRAMESARTADSPVAIRYPDSGDIPEINNLFTPYDTVRTDFQPDNPPENLIITYGRSVRTALEAERLLSGKTGCGIVLLESLKPCRPVADGIMRFITDGTENVVFLEEGMKNGGAGMVIGDMLDLPSGCRYTYLAIDDIFDSPLCTGEVFTDFGIGVSDVVSSIT